MSVSGFHVTDAHHHVGSLEAIGHVSKDTTQRTPEEYERVEVETRLAVMDSLGEDQAIVIPGHGYVRPDGLADTRRINDAIAAYRDRLPARFPAAIGVVEPVYGPRGFEELERVKHELRLSGVSFHVRFQGVSTHSPLVLNLVRKMAELDLVPYIHAIGGHVDENLWKVQELARAIPATNILVLDAFSTSEQASEALRVGPATPNLLFDTSLCSGFELIEPMIERIGPERVVFGTDQYSATTPDVRPVRRIVLQQIVDSGLDRAAKQAILSGNIRRLLGLA